jgi:hypothetical protein
MCKVAGELWPLLVVLFQISWVIPKMIVELLASLNDYLLGTEIELPLCLIWCIGQEHLKELYFQ